MTRLQKKTNMSLIKSLIKRTVITTILLISLSSCSYVKIVKLSPLCNKRIKSVRADFL